MGASSETPRHSVSVAAAIIDDQDRVLAIQRRDNGAWEPPGGVLELGEAISDGLRREVREETGLDIEPERLTGVYKNMTRGIVALVFRCVISGGQLASNGEAEAFRWLSQAELDQLTRERQISEAFAVRLLDAFRDGQAPTVREHDGTCLLR